MNIAVFLVIDMEILNIGLISSSLVVVHIITTSCCYFLVIDSSFVFDVDISTLFDVGLVP